MKHIKALYWQNAEFMLQQVVHVITIVFQRADIFAQYTTYCLLLNSQNSWTFYITCIEI